MGILNAIFGNHKPRNNNIGQFDNNAQIPQEFEVITVDPNKPEATYQNRPPVVYSNG